MSTSSATACQSTECPNGNPPSHLECPTCNKLGIKGSFFCSQECFKGSYIQKVHKAVHNLVQASNQGDSGSYNPFPNYPYTGTLRPVYPLSPKRLVPAHIPRPDYADSPAGTPTSELRRLGHSPRILSVEEQEKMRTVCRLGREILDIAASHVKPGITTDEIDEIVHNATIERNAYPSPLNYRKFPKSVCTSVNEVICHGIPDGRKLKDGDIINIDVSLYFDGHHGDLNATYPVGTIDEESKKLLRVTRESLDEAIKMCKPGALFRDIGKVIEPVARQGGCSVVRTYTGHGINDLFHCSPNIPHYAKNKAVGTMRAGMVFTIEPMINLGSSWSDEHWPDNWTAVTSDGKRSAQFEETLLSVRASFPLNSDIDFV
ncbi:methionine aminopeptidase [Sistotremastrum suecicum HHB10207 ss-3]|uniref:Methionine aminopeptidase n=1 Tax=Sistotremastrum suecicum HHB10207 ss-3 TaxID=1314776 RepID=A0A165Y9R7_9AGAM|nr:methionine aminopeptidase [Sistotremastrum suecicum HHB10207 ss-3]